MVRYKKGDLVYLNSEPEIILTVAEVFEDEQGVSLELIYYCKKDEVFKKLDVSQELVTLAK